METKDKDLFEELKSLSINYGKEDVRSRYVNVANETDLTKFIKFCDEGVEDKILHCTISVKIDDENSDFIPFVVGWGRSKAIARKLLENGYKSIFYTHVDLINDVIDDCCKCGEDRSSINRLSFRAVWNADKKTVDFLDGYSYIPNVTPKTDEYWYKHASDDVEITPLLRKLVLRNDLTESSSSVGIEGAGSFVYEIMKSYNEMDSSIKELSFHFINVDRNLNKTDLTRVMFIYQDESFFMKNFFERSFPRIREVASAIRTRYVYDLLAKSRYEATKSAKAAIMSRNMSHNIGSHVMSYLKQKLGSITAIMSGENKVLYNLIDGEKVNLNVLEKKPAPKVENEEQSASEKKNQLQLPFLVGTGRFIGYLQERQDYIATIATDYIPYGAPVNLKDAIYDELNPDLRYMRHKADDNKPMNVLLSFIAKSEGLSRENMDNCSVENDVKADKFDTNHDILFGFPKYVSGKKEPEVFGLLPGQCESENEALTVMRKINFSLPGGLVGRQAIFSIVENLIRNAAKHGDRSHTRKNNLEFTFDVIDLAKLEEEPCLEDRICSERWRNLYEKASDRRDLYLFTITDNLAYPTGEGNLAEKLRPALTDDYVDDMGNMNTSNKGIKEIRISAAWMRGEVDETRYLRYDDSANALSRKKAPLVGLEITNEGHLRYMICLPQDRLAAVITDGLSEADLELFRDLNKYSSKDWTLCSIDEAKANNKTSYHYILVANKELYDQIRPVTSNRLFVWNLTNEERAELDECRRQEKADSARYKLTRNAIVRKLYGINAESDPVCIWDGKTKDNEDSNLDKSVSDKIKIFRTDENADEARYVYRTHHSTDANFEDYWKKKSQTAAYGNILRIDAITGDNSSDRIVRREPLNEEWYCSHLRALKKRVAIFDERLFKIVHNVDERKFIPERQGDGDSSSSISSYIMRLKNNENLQTIKEEIVRQKLLGEETEKVMMFVDTAEELIKELEHQAVYFIPQSANNYKSIIYQEKGVDVFTIIKEKKNTFAIVGYIGHYTDKEGMLQATKYDKVATITFTADPFDVKIDFQHDEFAKQYDYISIHQGILDKIYEGFGIKDQGEANDLKKCHVTKRLHEEFMREGMYTPIPVVDREGNAQSGDLDFLPCFIIHSGRAKPTKNDMPQELPFVQYAAIEHGVQDCKYALVELLDYARYES